MAVAGAPMPGTPETAEFLDIQMQQVTGCFVFVASDRFGRLQRGQVVESGSLQQTHHGARRQHQVVSDGAISLAGATTFQGLSNRGHRRGMGTDVRARGSVHQAGGAYFAKPSKPRAGGAYTDPGRLGRFFGTRALLRHAFNEKGRL